jgi:hypothetical protein
LQQVYKLVEELSALWEETGAGWDQRLADTESFASVATKEMQKHVVAWKQRHASLGTNYDALKKTLSETLVLLSGDIDQTVWDQLKLELDKTAEGQTLDARFKALQEVQIKISQRVTRMKEMREAVEKSFRLLGLDPAAIPTGGAAALEDEMIKLRALLLERRSKALQLLDEEADEIKEQDEVKYLQLLNAEVERLEARVESLQTSAVKAACRARSLLEELGESPLKPRDVHVLRLSSAAKPLTQEAKSAISRIIAAAVDTSLIAWEAHHESAKTEMERLHKGLHAFGTVDVVKAFLQENGTIHSAHRLACRLKLDEILKEVRESEVPALQHLRQLYDDAGWEAKFFKEFAASLDTAESRQDRSRMIAKETRRVECYIESVKQLLGPIRELKALVAAAVAFEANVQAGQTRFSGNSLHFLEEEKFRRRFGHRFPELRDGLIEAITAWEAKEGKKFTYHGLQLCEGLQGIRGLSVALVRTPGDLSIMGEVMKLLSIVDPGQPAPRHHPMPKSGSRSPTSPLTPAAKKSRSTSASPVRNQGKVRRTRSVPSLARAAVVPETSKPSAPVLAPDAPGFFTAPKPPRYPEGVGSRGRLASVAAASIAGGIRHHAAKDCRGHLPPERVPFVKKSMSMCSLHH